MTKQGKARGEGEGKGWRPDAKRRFCAAGGKGQATRPHLQHKTVVLDRRRGEGHGSPSSDTKPEGRVMQILYVLYQGSVSLEGEHDHSIHPGPATQNQGFASQFSRPKLSICGGINHVSWI